MFLPHRSRFIVLLLFAQLLEVFLELCNFFKEIIILSNQKFNLFFLFADGICVPFGRKLFVKFLLLNLARQFLYFLPLLLDGGL